MIAPYTRNWSANELSDLVGRNSHVEVKGEVETGATNLKPKLSYRVPQGFNPRILLLDLTIESEGGFGGQVVMFRKVDYSRPTSGNDYDEVDILFEGAVIQRITVGHPMTLAAALAQKPPKKASKKTSKKTSKKKAGKKSAKKGKKKKAGKKKRL